MDIRDLVAQQRQAILDGDAEAAAELAERAVGAGADLLRCIEDGYAAGIREVGQLWEDGDYFLPELVQGADAMKAAMRVLQPRLLADQQRGGAAAPVKVVLGTVAGDIHDIGKTLVATFLEANGFEVIDLGADVAHERFVEAAREHGAGVVGLSALLTTTMSGQARVVELLRQAQLDVAVMVGGAPVTRAHAERIGADGFAANAVNAVAECQRLARQRESAR